MRFEDQRKLLVRSLAESGIRDELVLKAFETIPREDYVSPELRNYAYRNQPLPLSERQTISQPLMIAVMMQHLCLSPEDIVLEIGTGSGYQAALLSKIVNEVCTIERIESLSLKAQKLIKAQGIKNVFFRIGDGWSGWEKAYPPHKFFSKIVVTAAASEIPEKLVEQLSPGGIMVVPVGDNGYQILTKVIKTDEGISITHHGACTFVPMIKSS